MRRAGRLQRQGALRELVGLFDVGALVAGARAFQALDQCHQTFEIFGAILDALAQVDVGAFAVDLGGGEADLVVQPAGVRVPGQQPRQIGVGAAQLLGAAQDDRAGFQNLLVVRIGGQRLVEQLFGLGALVVVIEHARHVQPGVDQGLLQGHGLARPAHGGGPLALLVERAAELALEFGIARVGAHQLGEDRLGAHAIVEVQQHIAAISTVPGRWRG